MNTTHTMDRLVFFVTPENQKRLTKDQMGVEVQESEDSYNLPY